MNIYKDNAIACVDGISDKIIEISHKIWEYAELSLKEFKSADLYVKECEAMGFEVKKGISGIETAFSASYGSGRPVIGILAEYDALSGLSQKAFCPEKAPLVPGASGHGCGHNMLGAGSFGAACAVKVTWKRAVMKGLSYSSAVPEKKAEQPRPSWQETGSGRAWTALLPGIREIPTR